MNLLHKLFQKQQIQSQQIKFNKIYCMDVREGLKLLPDESIDCVITSPPYWGLRDYGLEPVVWDSDPKCEHQWGNELPPISQSNWDSIQWNDGRPISASQGWKDKVSKTKAKSSGCFCIKCGAWKGSLGLEPDFNLYIKHLCDIFNEVKRVLKKTGTVWVNLGDTYWGGGQGGADYGGKEVVSSSIYGHLAKGKRYQSKCLVMIPFRFAIEMVNRGWILRNIIIWYKPNAMPSSVKDRFTVDFEYVFFFTKNNKTIYWINEKTKELVTKQPLGIKGIEGKDWEWRECPNCRLLDKAEKKNCIRCNGTEKIKFSLWSGRNYYFEQQFEKVRTEYIYSRNTKKGDIQEKNNPRKRWGLTKQELKIFQYKGQAKKNYEKAGAQNPSDTKRRILDGQKQQLMMFGNIYRNKRTVWMIPTESFPEAHFAVYPEKFVEIPIKAGCPKWICPKCGMPREKIIEREGLSSIDYMRNKDKSNFLSYQGQIQNLRAPRIAFQRSIKIKGYSSCNCGVKFEPGIVLDPFMGSGTTALVALKLGRKFIGFELSPKYVKIAKKRIGPYLNRRLDEWS